MLVALTATTSQGASATTSRTQASIGDKCLVGTWRQNVQPQTTKWNGTVVKMRYGGGDIDHFFANGTERDDWNHSKDFVGAYQGYRLVEWIRGSHTETLRVVAPRQLRASGGQWSSGSSNTYSYRGHTYVGYLNNGGTWTDYYRCSTTTLTWLSKSGKKLSTETRLSRTP